VGNKVRVDKESGDQEKGDMERETRRGARRGEEGLPFMLSADEPQGEMSEGQRAQKMSKEILN